MGTMHTHQVRVWSKHRPIGFMYSSWDTYTPSLNFIRSNMVDFSVFTWFFKIFRVWSRFISDDPGHFSKTSGFMFTLWGTYTLSLNFIWLGMFDLACSQAISKNIKISYCSIFDQNWSQTRTNINRVHALIVRNIHTEFELGRTRHAGLLDNQAIWTYRIYKDFLYPFFSIFPRFWPQKTMDLHWKH